jgi:Type I phosphodiesterase / nucleotide pyrophosphatase
MRYFRNAMSGLGLVALAALGLAVPAASATQPHNVILFVPDGLRALIVDERTAPAMAAVRDKGVNFKNPHSLFPTFTTPNASAMATGHYLGDTGDFSNIIYTGLPIAGTVTPFLESDPVLGDIDEHFAGDYLDEVTLLKAARAAGLSTATIGKLGPALIFDHTERTGTRTVVIDDSTGSPSGIPLSEEMQQALRAAGLPLAAPSRGDNGNAGNANAPGTKSANVVQQNYFVEVATKVVLPLFKARKRPFVLVFWSRDPDGTQHYQGDSLNRLVPGINGPTSLASIRNADDDLARIEKTLDELGLTGTTDIFVSADHGFATISKESKTSSSTRAAYPDVPSGFLPPGFLAIDLATALGLPLFDPDAANAAVERGRHPSRGNGLIGRDPSSPEIVVAANGGSDLVYLVKKDGDLAARVVDALMSQDYVSGLFVDDSLGRLAGTLPLSAVNLKGSALTPMPTIAVNFRSFSTGCERPLLCTAEIADTPLQQGQGMHGSFSRAETMNFMAAIGPDFKKGFVDQAPTSNADVGKTLAHILGLEIKDHGKLAGRVLSEAMPGGRTPNSVRGTARSEPTAAGIMTVLNYQRVGRTRYFDAAGFPEKTVGLTETEGKPARSPKSGQPAKN